MRLQLSEFVPPGGFFHIARASTRDERMPGVHDHDYHEVFWVVSGTGVHQVNGQRHPLVNGDLVLMRPRDRHAFICDNDESLEIVNVAFSSKILKAIEKRYFNDRPSPWHSKPLPAIHHLKSAEFEELEREARKLARIHQRDQRLAHIDAFLLNLLTLLSRDASSSTHDHLPEWLAGALMIMRSETHLLKRGLPTLVELTGRSREHLGRLLKAHHGQTPTQWINEMRLLKAAEELRMTGKSILEISQDCGFDNLSYFYRRFQQKHGCSPRRYRLRAEAIVPRGD